MKYASRCIPHTLGLSTSIDTKQMKIWDWELHLYDSRGLTYQRYSGTEHLNAPPPLFLPEPAPTTNSTSVLLRVRGDIGRRLLLASRSAIPVNPSGKHVVDSLLQINVMILVF